MLDVKILRLSTDAVIPTYAKLGDAGLDLVATSKEYQGNSVGIGQLIYGTGLAIEIPEGYVGLLFPRSSISKTSLSLANSVGVIDSGYRGEIKMKFIINSGARPTRDSAYSIGERIGQLLILPYPKVNIIESAFLSESERGDGGFGSSGR